MGRFPTCSSPVRHVCPRRDHVRLACIRHAASVNPEPGSNSPPKLPVLPKKPQDFSLFTAARISQRHQVSCPERQSWRVGPPSSAAQVRSPAHPRPHPRPPAFPPAVRSVVRSEPADPATNLSKCCTDSQRVEQKKTAPKRAGNAQPPTLSRFSSDRLRRPTKRNPPVTCSRSIQRSPAVADGGRL
jgi:hypothetical protein